NANRGRQEYSSARRAGLAEDSFVEMCPGKCLLIRRAGNLCSMRERVANKVHGFSTTRSVVFTLRSVLKCLEYETANK
ncbi:MAG: hypothetical protein WAN49_22095, partial [Pseudolabrys sp.]